MIDDAMRMSEEMYFLALVCDCFSFLAPGGSCSSYGNPRRSFRQKLNMLTPPRMKARIYASDVPEPRNGTANDMFV